MEFNDHIFGSCWFLYVIMFTTYETCKLSIWYYYISRLEILFFSTPSLNYHPTLVKALKIIFFITAIFIGTIAILGMAPQNSQGQCVLYFKIWVYGSVIMPDTLMNGLCYYLFHRKMKMLTELYQLSFVQKQNEGKSAKQSEKKLDPQLVYVLRKFTILCAVTIVSTWIGAGIILFAPHSSTITACFDSTINVWCILLYDCRYDYLYLKVFGCIAKSEWKSKMTARAPELASEKTATENVVSPDPNIVQVIIR